ncbi:hypothetical protein FIM10_18665 [Sphingomonadales bacterium 56]|uniref:Restriction endonuclease type IV Mrr domain-containing protein n=1 Tax=Sphingobium indicum TaxID=332055 RepID=A0A4Q4IS25_9SPHN|nr:MULTISPECIES: hypothetical protein [Sphingobium]MBY2930706.1 hypothetical protein [Sphingomonadales bacterium 56]MBY2960752.1 hypothetical protein [Sphingomonadales bacterium 58]NYI25044.1 hypothetical protein [Sphingobium indicum]RYL96238.1 hypothetical protein EWH08_19840 [Sphingobium indicum]CAD7341788.1 hypothetical protein SPHS6_03759 [Sphingobium sp. S6]
MGVMKDLHIESMNLEDEWQELLVTILESASKGEASRMKGEIDRDDEAAWELSRHFPDIELTPHDTGEAVAVEFKMFRWRNDWQARAVDAISHMRDILDRTVFERGIIILSLETEQDDLAELSALAGDRIAIWDLFTLRGLIGEHAKLADELDILVSETLVDGSPAILKPRATGTITGAALATRLRAVPAGQPGWIAFEQGCHEAVRSLFGRELHKLVTQQRSDDGLNRMDLIGRIGGATNSFWSMISSDFSTRYVVFDAKNHGRPVGQDEVHSTAKYLMEKGLRKVAIIIAREGGSDHARLACNSYLREQGFLILIISRADLCRMLEDADAGDPPENILFDRMDDALMAMSR